MTKESRIQIQDTKDGFIDHGTESRHGNTLGFCLMGDQKYTISALMLAQLSLRWDRLIFAVAQYLQKDPDAPESKTGCQDVDLYFN